MFPAFSIGACGDSAMAEAPGGSMWPEGTRSVIAVCRHDLQSRWSRQREDNDSASRIVKSRGLAFVLFFPETKRWVKDGAKDYFLPLKPTGAVPDLSEIFGSDRRGGSQNAVLVADASFQLCHDLLMTQALTRGYCRCSLSGCAIARSAT